MVPEIIVVGDEDDQSAEGVGDQLRGDDHQLPRGNAAGDLPRQNAFFAVMSAVMSWVLVRGEGGDRTTREDGDRTTREDNGNGGRTHGVDDVDGEGNGGGQGNGRLSGLFLRLLACCAANAAGDPEDAAPLLPTVTSSAAVNPVVPPNRFFRLFSANRARNPEDASSLLTPPVDSVARGNLFSRVFSSCFGRGDAIEETPAAAAAEPDLWKNFFKASHTSIQWLLFPLMVFVPAKILSQDADLSVKLRAIVSAVQLKFSEVFIPAVLIYVILCSGSASFKKRCLMVCFQLLSLAAGVFGVVVLLGYTGFAPSNLAIGIGVASVAALVIAKFYDHFSS